jgi:hypothetical protein
MKTAVEWYCNEMESLRVDSEIGNMKAHEFLIRRADIFHKAKEMEKKQSECICVNVIEMILNESEQGKEINSKEIFEQCYNETFKSE